VTFFRKENVMAQAHNSANKRMEGCVMLALSTFRKSENAMDTAIEKARDVKKLVVVYVADINLARYLVDVNLGLYGDFKDTVESEILKKHEKEGKKPVETFAEKAGKQGIEVKTHIEVGRFALLCPDVARKEKPSWIVTTRSKRPEWVRKLFGAPVDDLIAEAGCPVVVV
jgi:nucleotide-binding universal stress UspA family protein